VRTTAAGAPSTRKGPAVAFNLELIKTKLLDTIGTLEKDLGPAVERIREAIAAVIGQVHAQESADETTIKNQVIGDVKTVEDAAAPADNAKKAAK